jgi:hypothetical protein
MTRESLSSSKGRGAIASSNITADLKRKLAAGRILLAGLRIKIAGYSKAAGDDARLENSWLEKCWC